MLDDATLVQQAQAGSQEAFCELVTRHQSRAMSIALGLLGHREEAKDVSQEAFVTAYRSLAGFRGQASFATWFYRILVNKCQDALRARNRSRRWLWQPQPKDDAEEDVFELVPSKQPSARDVTHAADVARTLQTAIQRLSPRQRAVVTLRYTQAMSVEETAQAIGCAPGTVKAQLSRALRHLRAHVDGQVEASDT